MKKLNTQEWILLAKEVHGNRFDYTMTSYVNAKTKLIIICPEHREQEMLPQHHIKNYGCSECGKKQINLSSGKQLSQEDFISRVGHISNLDFSKTEYVNKRSKVIVTCVKHGDYEVTAEVLLKGSGCRKCTQRGTWNLKNTDQFIEKAIEIHNNLYSYEDVNYIGVFDKVTIKCNKHGNFMQTAATHLKGSGCPRCKNSKGELYIYNYLLTEKIIFETQKTFTGCKDTRHLKFDFYLSTYNACIEFDGEQHYRQIKNHWGGEKEFLNRLRRDEIKTNYCLLNNIPLLRIKYDNPNIQETIKEFLQKVTIN